ncbi:hypothetical protein D7B24_007632 [Verticillium nonalfalfae]|uniref:Uncharacterized protein n=1 Tax=Verticillium nonalfalfae TaxID=1051616 RepID=A0A3M9Y6L1_9PEZI|nr:uncharacterized protein D7B24_007632 [Verticillium nonalfalfae]RNJ56149.1 hypothetical protein D7B24_007632 [Verticillium nonalfalfae]
MVKPRLIILIRHAQSEGNKNREIHQAIPDHRVKLTPEGWNQAYEAGRSLRKLLRADDTLHFFTSPYRRTRETTEGILATLTSDDDEPSPFKRSNITVHEEPRLREQDFGNFQPCSAEMERMWQERADYGHFFYRIPNGESAADAYDRVSGFNESLWRQFGDNDFASVCVLVTHGLMSRVFLMKWYHFTVEYFEDLRNVNHCEFLIMRKQEESGKYILENNLRTWSELRRERVLQGKEKQVAPSPIEKTKSFVPTRRWGGCPNGCNHQSHYVRRDDLESLRQTDEKAAAAASTVCKPHSQTHSQTPSVSSLASRRPVGKRFQLAYGSDEDHDDEESGTGGSRSTPQIDVVRSHEEVVSSPDGTPSYISAEDRLRSLRSPHLHIGRDGGGTYSGHASLSNSDAEDNSEDEHAGHRGHGRVASLAAQLEKLPTGANGRHANGHATDTPGGHVNGKGPIAVVNDEAVTKEDASLDEYGMVPGARANRLGDALSSVGSDGGRDADDDDDIDRAERADRSIQGSVY